MFVFNRMSKIEEAINVIIQELNLQTENDAIFCERVSKKMMESFSGYHSNVREIFANKLPNEGLTSAIEFKDIEFLSYCKHHLVPIVGKISVSYVPNQWIVGLSRIVECVNVFTQRLQLQESLTVEIANCIFENLEPKSVLVEIEARHYCMKKSPNDAMPLIRTSHKL